MSHFFAAQALAKWGTRQAWHEEMAALWQYAIDNPIDIDELIAKYAAMTVDLSWVYDQPDPFAGMDFTVDLSEWVDFDLSELDALKV